MSELKARAVIATCIDYRLQNEIDDWISKNFKPDTYDRISLAGGIKNLDIVLDQIKIARDLHGIEKSS